MSFSSFSSSSRELLNFIAETLFQELHADEALLIRLRGEETEYVRWTAGKVRQCTSVLQRQVVFDYQKNQRELSKGFSASGNLEWDLIEARQLLQQARLEIEALPLNPYLIPFKNHGNSEAIFEGALLSAQEIMESVEALELTAKKLDFAAFYAGGTIVVGNRNSCGQNHWFSNESFFLDYSLYDADRAVKGAYAGFQWQHNILKTRIDESAQTLQLLNKPRKRLSPGSYRVYLAPAAVAELCSVLSRGALSYKAFMDGDCAFAKLAKGERTLSKLFSLSENFTQGLTPRFNHLGELAQEKITLIENGELKTLLINASSAAEYNVTSNQANAEESLRALEIAPGVLSKERILQELGTGLFLSHLHYTNWSDVQCARVTGMTRFACFWVENGQQISPVEDMRFDVSLLDAFGANLVALTDFQELDPDVQTYEERALGGPRVPGMLIENFSFTL